MLLYYERRGEIVWGSLGALLRSTNGEPRVHFPLGVPERGRLLLGTDHSTLCGAKAFPELLLLSDCQALR